MLLMHTQIIFSVQSSLSEASPVTLRTAILNQWYYTINIKCIRRVILNVYILLNRKKYRGKGGTEKKRTYTVASLNFVQG